MAGERTFLKRRERRAIDAAVKSAESSTGLQFCVYLGPGHDDERAHAESLFVEAGLHERPAVLLLVAPDRRHVEIVTAEVIRQRVTDDACARAIEAMTPLFASGRYVDGLVLGLGRLAEEAGPGTPGGATDLPNVLGE